MKLLFTEAFAPIVLLAGLLADTAGAAPAAYQITDLGRFAEVVAINDSGEVVGNQILPDGSSHAFLYSAGRMHDLGTLGGPSSFAVGINAAGVVVGNSDETARWPSANPRDRRHRQEPFIYKNGSMRPIDPGPAAALAANWAVRDINDRGQLAIELPLQEGAILSPGAVVSLGTLIPEGVSHPMGWQVARDGTRTPIISHQRGYVVPCRINSAGQVIGSAATPDGKEHAVLYSNGVLRDLGAMEGGFSAAKDVNSAGEIVGISLKKEGVHHAFLYANGKMIDLGVPAGFEESSAEGISDSGEVVGSGYTARSGGFLRLDVSSRPFLYQNGRWVDLTARVDLAGSGLTSLYDAQRINARGQIIGKADGPEGWHGYLLTPIAASVAQR